jgi:Uma2 family endonuclease
MLRKGATGLREARMATAAAEKKRFTYQDYLKTPDDKQYELIEGDLVMTPSPVPYHQWISKNIGYEVERFVREKDPGKVFYAPCDVYLDDENVLQPDILFISKERRSIIGEKNIQGAPDLVIEILSEATAYRDLVKKKKLYERFGVKEYWIVDPQEKTIEIYAHQGKDFVRIKTFSEIDTLESPFLAGLRIELSSVFAF